MAKPSTIPDLAATERETPGPKASPNQPCLIAQSLAVIGDRWTLLILRDLMSGLHRYSDILENCAGMSPNVLSDRLKRLEAAGLVNREYFRELPPRVEYTLTEQGWAVRPILLSLIEWGSQYPAVVALWRNSWERFVPFLQFPAEIRRVIYTTDDIVNGSPRVVGVSSARRSLRRRVLAAQRSPFLGRVAA